MGEPKLIFYADKEQTKPLKLIDFGEIDADESSVAEVYVINFGNRDLRKIQVIPTNDSLEILESPIELPVGILSKMRLRWKPRNGEDLLAPLVIKGKYYKKKK